MEEGRARFLGDVGEQLNFRHTENEQTMNLTHDQTYDKTHDVKDNQSTEDENNADGNNEKIEDENIDKNDTNIVNMNTNTDTLNVEKDDVRPQQTQAIGGEDQDTIKQTTSHIYIVIGDSDAKRVHFEDPDVLIISQPGASAAAVEPLRLIAKSKTTNKNVKRVAMHLGTVNVAKHKFDANQVILEVSSALTGINKVQVSKDQEKVQSEKDSHSKNRGGKKPN